MIDLVKIGPLWGPITSVGLVIPSQRFLGMIKYVIEGYELELQ